jgi:hypothetical protein
MADADIAAQELVQQLWAKAEGELLSGRPLVPDLPDFEAPEHDGDLRYLNGNWAIDPADEGPSQGPEWRTKAKTRFTATVLSSLDRYFEQERDFLAHSVRVANTLAGWSGRLAREIRIVAQAIGDESARLVERQDILHRRTEARIAELEARVAELEGR